MKKLQEVDLVDDNLILLYLNNEFCKLNIELTEKQLDNLLIQLKKENTKFIDLELTDEQLLNTKYQKEDDIKDDFWDILQNKDNRQENFINDINSDSYQKLSDRFSRDRLNLLYRKEPAYSILLREGNKTVSNNINNDFADVIYIFELLINTTIEITQNFNVEKLVDYEDNKALYDALQRLQGRACLISNEILVLLKAGFSDGAYARCRTLYETMVISSFISEQGNETAKRYLDYSFVSELKEVKEFNKNNEIFGDSLELDEELVELEKKVEQLKYKYGESFIRTGDYAWAYTLRKSEKHKINFSDLVSGTKFEHMNSFYKSSSNNIHTGSINLYFHRALARKDSGKILMGASNFGIEEPFSFASKCINMVTSNLLLRKTQSLEQLIQGKLLFKIYEDLEELLFEIGMRD